MSKIKIKSVAETAGLSVAPGPNAKIFILPTKFQRRRLEDMKHSISKKGLQYSDMLSPDVTHIVSECESLDQVERHATKYGDAIPKSANVVSTKWLVECLKVSQIVLVKDLHKLKKEKSSDQSEILNEVDSSTSLPEWACQRKTKLNHLNLRLTSAVETLQEHAELRDGNQDYSRALAFRRASSVLKALPFTIQSVWQLRGLKDIGDHVKGVIEDILDHGSSSEVDAILNSKWFKEMKLFTSVFGVGPSTAKAWIERGWESLEDARRNGCPSGDWRIAWGLAFFDDLNTPVQCQEADTFCQIVKWEAEQILPGVIVTLVGGFRRGKPQGHDVDILLSHSTEGAEDGLLPKLLAALGKRGLILVGHKEKSSFRSDVLYQDFKLSARGQLDHFEKWLGICKFPKSFNSPTVKETDFRNETLPSHIKHTLSQKNTNKDTECCERDSFEESLSESYEPKVKRAKGSDPIDKEPNELSASSRDWLARRVDLIIAPYSQYFYALVGWTGSKHFNRDARLYAQKTLSLKLTSHGLFDTHKRESLSAQSEEEVFSHLKLPYIGPTDRNC